MTDPVQPSPPRRFRVSLAARLGLGFAAIAIVVLLGQKAAQRDMHDAIETLTRTQTAQVPISRVADALTYRVAAFDRAVLAQIRTPTDANRTSVTEAEQELLSTLDSYADLQKTASPEIARFRKEVQEHTRLGRSLIDIGARRDVALGGIRDALDQLSRRISTAFSVDMRLPDPSLARRAYAELELELGRLRTAFNDYLVSGSESGDTPLRAATRSFRATVAEYSEELARSPGRAWLELVEEDLGRAEELRKDIARYDASIASLRGRFAESGLQLPLRLDAAFAAPASRAVSESAGSAVSATRSAEQAIQQLTYLVLGVTLLVSLLTVLSVTRPVRRLTRATQVLARGGRHVTVESGGSSELDALGEAFNQMSRQLAAADEEVAQYQRELESRVRTRTRKLTHLANHDPLTGLPNRRFAFNHLRRSVRSASRYGNTIGLIALDIDNFKVINDNFGHSVGDLLLRAVADRLRLLAGERRFIARLGGDEFIVLLEDANPVGATAAMAERIVNAFRAPLSLDGRDILVSVSVGVARLPEHASDAAGLVRAADAALFRAKELGRNCVVTFSHALLEGAEARFSVEQSLRRAIDAGEFTMVFQPQISMVDGRTDAVEALLRWQRTDGPLVPASEFIAIAERSGLIMEIGRWVLETATAAVAQWRAGGLENARVAINVSVHQLLDHRFVERLTGILARHGLPADAIELELTETAFQTSASTVEALQRIREGGLGLALDDFGTGYSSLTSLSRLPLRRVKLDRSLVLDAPANTRVESLARSIIGVCQNLGLGVTVEGIERYEQLAWLSRCGPVHAQGFLIGRPMTSAEVPEFVRNSPRRLDDLLARAASRAGGPRPVDPVVPFRKA
jgi:diguanylate cyclase (GGDEF)-like protein